MRADKHYVEQLDSPPSSHVIRMLTIASISTSGAEPQTSAPASSLTESIRHHGVLQPLLIQKRREGYRLIAGRKRLAAADAAGLTAVPCLVFQVDDEEAQKLALAANTQADLTNKGAATDASTEDASRTADELLRSLSRISSSSGLLEATDLTQRVLADLIRSETCRAWCLGHAMGAISGTFDDHREKSAAKAISQRVAELCQPERRLRVIDFETRASLRDMTDVMADPDLLVAAICGILLATFENPAVKCEKVTFTTAVESGSRVVFTVSRPRAGAKKAQSPSAFADVMLKAAEQIANTYDGRLLSVTGDLDVAVTLELPLSSSGN